MSELGYVIKDSDERKLGNYMVCAISFIFILISSYKLFKVIQRFEKNVFSVLVVLIHAEILSIFLSNNKIGRFVWCFLLMSNNEKTTQLFDSLVCVLSTFLGCTFTCLWVEMGVCNNPKYSDKSKNLYFASIIFILGAITLIDLGLHIYFSLFSDFSRADKKFLIFLINNTNKLTVSILLFLNSVLASQFVKLVYSSKAGRYISHNILIVSAILVVSYELKAIFPLFLSKLQIDDNT